MPNIKISDLHSTGSELFSDSESYMNELGDSEFNTINGGSGWPCAIVSGLLGPVVESAIKLSNPLNSF